MRANYYTFVNMQALKPSLRVPNACNKYHFVNMPFFCPARPPSRPPPRSQVRARRLSVPTARLTAHPQACPCAKLPTTRPGNSRCRLHARAAIAIGFTGSAQDAFESMLESNFGPLSHNESQPSSQDRQKQKQNTYFAITYHNVVGSRLVPVV